MPGVDFPSGWNPAFDLVVVVGEGGRPLAEELAGQGHQRLLWLLSEGTRMRLPGGATVVHSIEMLEEAITKLSPPHPKHFVCRILDDPVLAVSAAELSSAVERGSIANRVQHSTVAAFAETWVSQAITNLPHLAHWPSALGLSFAGLPLVIVSPGPSLGKNIHDLKRLKGRAILLALSQSLKALQAAGVVPDFAISIDAQPMAYLFEGYPVESLEGLLLAATSEPSLFQLPARRFFVLPGNSTLDAWAFDIFGDDAQLPNGGSAATTALSLALRWGCDPIIFVGQDLAFSGGKVYADGALDGAMSVAVEADGSFSFVNVGTHTGQIAPLLPPGLGYSHQTVPVAGYHGGEVLTSKAYRFFLQWFERAAKKNAGRVRLLNCTEGGALIAGMEHVPLARAIDRHATTEIDIGAVLDRAISAIDRPARQRKLDEALHTLSNAIARSSMLANQCLGLLAKRSLDELAKREEALGRILPTAPVLSLLRQGQIAEAMRAGSTASTLDESLRASAQLYAAVLQAAQYCEDLLRSRLGTSGR